jgi:hypothetical protein
VATRPDKQGQSESLSKVPGKEHCALLLHFSSSAPLLSSQQRQGRNS